MKIHMGLITKGMEKQKRAAGVVRGGWEKVLIINVSRNKIPDSSLHHAKFMLL